jgi:hypothetical protein
MGIPANPDIRALYDRALALDPSIEHADVCFEGDVTHEIRGERFWLRAVAIKGCSWHFSVSPRNAPACATNPFRNLEFRFGTTKQLQEAVDKFFLSQ